jgi:hypothetical protein
VSRPLDPAPYRNRYDGSRWPDNGDDPWLLPFEPREGYEQNWIEYQEGEK